MNEKTESYKYLSASMMVDDKAEEQTKDSNQPNIGTEKIMSEIYYV